MESPLDAAVTGEIRRHLEAAQVELDQLQALLAPMPDGDALASRPRGGEL